MSRTRCQLCGEFIKQRDEIIRVVVEVVTKAKGDDGDPSRWSGMSDQWDLSFIAHTECAREEIAYREYQVEIPAMGVMFGLLEQEEETKSHLELLPGGQGDD